jgi:hypothetical protein
VSTSGIQDLRNEVAQLRRDVAALRLQLTPAPSIPAAAPSPPDPRVDPQARADADNARIQRAQSLESSFRIEPYDARWSQASTAQIRAALSASDGGIGSQVRGVECRSKSCRIEFNIEDSAQLQKALPIILTHLAPALANVTAAQVDQGDGRSATVLFLAH